MTILEKLGLALPSVENPARYMGGEANSVIKNHDQMLAKMAFVFPDLYEIGMSNNGMRILYHVINREPDLLCEVAFAPWFDMAEQMKTLDIPLYTHASWTAVSDYDVIGITLQTELNFTNVPYILDLSRVSIWAEEREEKEPFVIGGGPAMANPEPVADFFDAFIIGDGEKSIVEVMQTIGEGRKNNITRLEILKNLSALDGVYVPSLRPVILNKHNQAIPAEPATGSYTSTKGVRRLFIPEMNPADYPTKNLIGNMQLVHNRFSVEVMRGCSQGCRFCQAGIWYRPCRELNPDDVIDIAKEGIRATGERELGLLSLSTADYKPVEALADSIIDDPFFGNIDVSLPSIRVNSYGQGLAAKAAALKGGRSTTFAPETGSTRIRKMINKTISNEDMYNAAEYAFSNKFNKIKLYTMVGFPTENLQDMEEFCELIEHLVQIGRAHSKGIQIAVSIGIFIPKAFTPLQWSPFVDKETALSHIRFVRERFFRHPNVKINWSAWETSVLEAFYSRGDRSISKLIYQAYKKGLLFESDNNTVNYEAWEQLWQEFKYDYSWLFETRDLDEVFPWDFIHAGVSKNYLRNEWIKAFDENAAPVPNCKWGDCQSCGIPGAGKDIKLASNPVKYAAPSRSPEDIKALLDSRKTAQGTGYLYKITFEKAGLSRFLPHQNTLGCFERIFFCLDIPIKFSEGFSPKPRIVNIGALPLGLETYCEIISIELLKKLDLSGFNHSKLLEKLNLFLPRGIRITKIEPLAEKLSKNFPKAMVFKYTPEKIPSTLETLFREKNLPVVFNHRGVEVNLNEHILDLQIIDKAIITKVKCNDQGGSVSPYTIYAGLMGLENDASRLDEIARTFLIQKIALEW